MLRLVTASRTLPSPLCPFCHRPACTDWLVSGVPVSLLGVQRPPALAEEDRAAHVGASWTPQEVMEHYISMYILDNLGKACIPDTIPNRVTDHTCPRGGPSLPASQLPSFP